MPRGHLAVFVLIAGIVLLAVFVLLAGIAVQDCDTGSGPPANWLSGETGLYLRAHARYPVDGYPWGAEAIERARGGRDMKAVAEYIRNGVQ